MVSLLYAFAKFIDEYEITAFLYPPLAALVIMFYTGIFGNGIRQGVKQYSICGPTAFEAGIILGVTGLLSVLIFPNFLRTDRPAYLTACKSNLKNIGTALEMYSTDHYGRYPTALSLLTPNYIKVIPTCAKAKKMTYEFTSREKPDCYTMYCSGKYHTEITNTPNYPQYDAINGLIEP